MGGCTTGCIEHAHNGLGTVRGGSHTTEHFVNSCPEWDTTINDPFCAKTKSDAVSNGKKYARPTIGVNGFRFRMASKKPRGKEGLCAALVLDLLDRTPASRPVLFDGETKQFAIPAQPGVHGAYVATKQAVLCLLHLCPHAFASAVVRGGPPPAVDDEAQPQLLALPHYKQLQLGDVVFRPKFTQANGSAVTRSVAS